MDGGRERRACPVEPGRPGRRARGDVDGDDAVGLLAASLDGGAGGFGRDEVDKEEVAVGAARELWLTQVRQSELKGRTGPAHPGHGDLDSFSEAFLESLDDLRHLGDGGNGEEGAGGLPGLPDGPEEDPVLHGGTVERPDDPARELPGGRHAGLFSAVVIWSSSTQPSGSGRAERRGHGPKTEH